MVQFTNPTRRTNNPDDQIGYEIELNDACVSNNDNGRWAARSLVPDNGEYELSKLDGACNICINCEPRRADWGSGCTFEGGFKCSAVGGGVPYYKRTAYTAPKDNCCTNNGTKTVENRTCDPKYRRGPQASECYDTYNLKCDNPDEIFSNNCKTYCDNGKSGRCGNLLNKYCSGALLSGGDPTCTNWCSQNPELCATRLREYCVGNNIDKQYCKDALVRIGGADAVVTAWCQNHPTDKFCSCFGALSDSTTIKDPVIKAVLSRPECYVGECSSGAGYKYTNMRQSGPCAPVNVCQNTINVVGNNYTDLRDINQTCNQEISTGVPAISNTTAPVSSVDAQGVQQGDPTANTTEYDFFSEYTTEIIGVLLLLFVVLIAVVLSDSSSENKSGRLRRAYENRRPYY